MVQFLLMIATLIALAECAFARGTVVGWCTDYAAQLGHGIFVPPRNSRVQTVGTNNSGMLTGMGGISGGVDYTLAVKSDGTAWAWGNGANRAPTGPTAQWDRQARVGASGSWVLRGRGDPGGACGEMNQKERQGKIRQIAGWLEHTTQIFAMRYWEMALPIILEAAENGTYRHLAGRHLAGAKSLRFYRESAKLAG